MQKHGNRSWCNKINYFYQFIQAGFDTQLPAKPMQHGIEVYREYRDAQGSVVTSASLGSELEVHIQARALANRHLSNIAIVDLLPGGFEVVRDSVKSTDLDYTDVREDRVIFFSSLDSSTKEIVYRIKAINPGHYALPAIFAESMYDPEVKAYSASGTMTVSRTRTVSK